MCPSLEAITDLDPTSIHVVGSNPSLSSLAERLSIPLYTYSFDTLDDIHQSCETITRLYSDADLTGFTGELAGALDSLGDTCPVNPLRVMIVIHLEEDGAITLAGEGTYFADIITGAGFELAAPGTGSYPSVSVEGILSLDPDRVIVLAPDGVPERIAGMWERNGLDPEGLCLLTGDHVLIPGARLPVLVREMRNCLN
jgi:ABC-type Fe3+-hydroxamate transport system substrate-binding protein